MLDKLRKEIDSIDKELLELFEKRLDICKQVGDYKRERNLPVFVPQREEEVLKSRKPKNPAYKNLTTDFFSTLMGLSRRLQSAGDPAPQTIQNSIKSPKVAYLGPTGSYSSLAQKNLFPDASETIAAPSFTGIFNLLNQGKADYGVLPIENTSTGAITDVLDLLYKNNLYIVDEVVLKISHTLSAPKGATLAGIKRVYSHTQGFLQCGEFLETLGNVERVTTSSTAEGGEIVARESDPSQGAIISREAAGLYGLVPLAENIQGEHNNTTRFVAVARHMENREHADKISLAFTLRHESGALCKALSIFSAYGLNLVYIESRPLPGRNFEYMFFTDFHGSFSGETEQKALAEIRTLCSSLQILGNYPSAKE